MQSFAATTRTTAPAKVAARASTSGRSARVPVSALALRATGDASCSLASAPFIANSRALKAERVNAAPARRSVAVKAEAETAAAVTGTPVKTTSILVVGATGTLGRQVVRKALDEGYDVRCLVRPRQNPADFLRDWGATTVSGDLTDPASIPAALVGIHTVIDCATSRPEEPISVVDWEGKKALIQSAQAMGIQRYVFFSIDKCDQHPEVPLMNVKHCTETFLAESGMNFTTFRLCGFMQGLVQQYAVPILEERTVYGTTDKTRTAYLDTTDVARMTMAALKTDATVGKTLTLAGPRAFTIDEVIALCERFAGADAKVNRVPVLVLKVTQLVLKFFDWSKDASDRLSFANVLTSDEVFAAPMDETYEMLGLEKSETSTLEMYLQEYYTRILKKLKEVGAQSRQNDYYL
mmetsp:Transcript_14383/g.45716  ORF Transcript_14383/g.45716 Transcript_14383/m.45716 type:complete len:408 (+) Transcript_14383:73-1296(+)|eukprot:CAMPEP_0182913792 /NCGR_PEP_ID=MMETSP0034_2-20130328/38220_1 /TAXON_ID=156128 /ORGANISM="Nephroselmis pyriformis, Strain CCMP717" /LENGTH=407 /DNA_ID=CAMNT_0025050521 /DNA_START=45 /DNA_END=1268 /DNA_ORIENTATION=-